MIVESIYTYPIKSLPGIELSKATVVGTGIEYDRHFMLIDENNNFITQRQDSKLTQFDLKLEDNRLIVYSKVLEFKIEIPLLYESKSLIEATIWNDTVSSVHINPIYDDFFSDHLGYSVRLVGINHNQPRQRNYSDKTVNLSFVDGRPITFLSQSSFDDLQAHVRENININQFRINVILGDCDSYDEENLEEFQINDCRFKFLGPITRCIIININQETGLKSKEPLRYLSRVKTIENKVVFGVNSAVLTGGNIAVGQRIIKI